MRSDLPSGTVTFLFTDVEGSTALLHELGAEAYAEALAEHRRVIRKDCAAEGGVEVDTQGDAFFFAFPTAPGALAAASSFTSSLAPGPIQVRVGLHTGTPLLTDEGYVGDDVHFAARVAGSGHGGQVILSAATAELVELELTDLGEHRLKDIAEAVPIYQLGNGSFPPLKTISNTNLPTPASSFVGRDDELLEVLSRFEDGARLVTLTGPGGTGKTRLAIEAAATLVPDYKAGVFWVGLATLRDPTLVTETIAQTLGARDGLAEHIGERELLLLLDNLEQVIDSASDIASLLEACPNLTLLVTSRELLRVRGEVEYAVPPLSELEAVTLFCARSQLEPSDEIAKLCRRLDDLPLAVELAAARTSVLTPEQILERVSQRLDLLKGARDADPRQQTLRATIEWSYDLLTPKEQQLLARLSVFAGGSRLEAADEVAEADVDTLQSLVEKSLLRFTGGRYWMLETIREYAAERLEQAGENEGYEERHAAFFLALAERLEPPPIGSGADEGWVPLLVVETDNLRLAVEFLSARPEPSGELRLAGSLFRFWEVAGLVSEGRRSSEHALERSAGADQHLRMKVLYAAFLCAFNQGDMAAAQMYEEERLAVARAVGDKGAVAVALSDLGILSEAAGDYEGSVSLYDESAALASELGDGITLLAVAINRGYGALVQGDYGRARRLLEDALEIAIRLGDVHGRAMVPGEPWFRPARAGRAAACRRAILRGARAFAGRRGAAGHLLHPGRAGRRRNLRARRRPVSAPVGLCQCAARRQRERVRIIRESGGRSNRARRARFARRREMGSRVRTGSGDEPGRGRCLRPRGLRWLTSPPAPSRSSSRTSRARRSCCTSWGRRPTRRRSPSTGVWSARPARLRRGSRWTRRETRSSSPFPRRRERSQLRRR